jgi:hypothetical protein
MLEGREYLLWAIDGVDLDVDEGKERDSYLREITLRITNLQCLMQRKIKQWLRIAFLTSVMILQRLA